MAKKPAAEKKPNRMVADGKTWKRVKTPRSWKPKEIGATLVGTFLGLQGRLGVHGPYEVALIKTEEEVYYVSGTVVVSLFTAANFSVGDLPTVRLIWQGYKGEDTETDRQYKDFDLYVADRAEAVRKPSKKAEAQQP